MIRPAQHVLLGQGRPGTDGPPAIGQPWQGGFYAGEPMWSPSEMRNFVPNP